MAYFQENASRLVIREGLTPNSGLRRGQVGALHALTAHFIERHEPAIASLPTGYGKTAVLTAACFLLQARRVLLVTPTAPLRSQAARAFRSMDTLRRLTALPNEDDLPGPRVVTVEERIDSAQAWRAFEQFDVVVCTPHSASPEMDGVAPPPEGLFDLVLVDEGHHSPARTWAAFIAATPRARHVLLSATPFRRDRRQLPGRLVFYYSLRRAVEENAFGKVVFSPVTVDEDALPGTRDAALVARAVEVFQRDAASGLQHRLFARAGRIADAEQLAAQYIAAGLRVEAVSSRKSRQQIEEIENRLIAGELDGVVCVDMFGEGYDFPKFKIAVLQYASGQGILTRPAGRKACLQRQRGWSLAGLLALPQGEVEVHLIEGCKRRAAKGLPRWLLQQRSPRKVFELLGCWNRQEICEFVKRSLRGWRHVRGGWVGLANLAHTFIRIL